MNRAIDYGSYQTKTFRFSSLQTALAESSADRLNADERTGNASFSPFDYGIYEFMKHLTTAEIEAGLADILESPKDEGILKLIVRRPRMDEREVLETGELDIEKGLVGDDWHNRDGKYETQLTIMNWRIARLLAQDKNRLKLAGDQLFIDINLTDENLPHGTKLEIGSAIIEITPQPHNGCQKFIERFGLDAMKFVNSPVGKQFHLRGIYAKVIKSGIIRQGDSVKKGLIVW